MSKKKSSVWGGYEHNKAIFVVVGQRMLGERSTVPYVFMVSSFIEPYIYTVARYIGLVAACIDPTCAQIFCSI